jgi:hypothetical protein
VLAAALCAIIGAVAGLLGIGGGELRLPVLVSFLALSVKLAITVNLAISVATLGTSLIRRLLRPGGRVIVNEHAWDRLDEPTARWYLEQRAATDADASSSVEQCLDEWAAEHAGRHDSAVMRTELDRRFEERLFVWTPYINRELGDAVDERAERALIEAGAIQATGFRYVGEPQAAPARGGRAAVGSPRNGRRR